MFYLGKKIICSYSFTDGIFLIQMVGRGYILPQYMFNEFFEDHTEFIFLNPMFLSLKQIAELNFFE